MAIKVPALPCAAQGLRTGQAGSVIGRLKDSQVGRQTQGITRVPPPSYGNTWWKADVWFLPLMWLIQHSGGDNHDFPAAADERRSRPVTVIVDVHESVVFQALIYLRLGEESQRALAG